VPSSNILSLEKHLLPFNKVAGLLLLVILLLILYLRVFKACLCCFLYLSLLAKSPSGLLPKSYYQSLSYLLRVRLAQLILIRHSVEPLRVYTKGYFDRAIAIA
jgi:hypothetical protein